MTEGRGQIRSTGFSIIIVMMYEVLPTVGPSERMPETVSEELKCEKAFFKRAG